MSRGIWAAMIIAINTWPVWLGWAVGDGHGMMLGVVAWSILNTGRGK
jgi:hypothetical protein